MAALGSGRGRSRHLKWVPSIIPSLSMICAAASDILGEKKVCIFIFSDGKKVEVEID